MYVCFRMSTSAQVTNICDFIDPGDSDFVDSDDSGDEYLPGDESSDDEETSARARKKRKLKKTPNQNLRRPRQKTNNVDSDSDDDMPLAAVMRKNAAANDSDSDGYSSDDDIPLAQLISENTLKTLSPEEAQTVTQFMSGNPVWTKMDFVPPDNVAFSGTLEGPDENARLRTPYQYFKDLITDQMLEDTAFQTNM